MLLKIVALFLVFMIVMASVQKWLGRGRRHPGIDQLRCPSCKAIRVGTGPCPCGQDRKD